MTLYLKPPRGVVNLHNLEQCINQRLTCYDNLLNDKLDLSELDCLIEDSSLDRAGHYLFRLVAYSNTLFREVFFKNELKLLSLRLSSYDKEDVKYFFKRLLTQSKALLDEGNASETLREIHIVLVKVCMQMLRRSYLDQIFDTESSKQFTIHVPFQFCASLVKNRDVDLKNGFALVLCRDWKTLLLSLYETYLRTALTEMKFSKNVQVTLSDPRIKEATNLIKNHWFKNPDSTVTSKFDVKFIDRESTLFPLCMLNLYKVLEKLNRLAHEERFDFSLYMKGIGVSLDDSLKFWRDAYSKQHKSCSKCTHSWAENEKRYIYGIRHLYGLEGSRKNYQVRSCAHLQGKSLCANENGGCPFRHFDDDNLRKVLHRLLPNQDDNVEVMIYERRENPSESCRLFYENIFKIVTSKVVDFDFTFQDPVQYYFSLKSNVYKNEIAQS